ncbi:hypothetical protein K7X08_027083 [Anisodus acutangulus]|uniref:Uncharacterized protein n=1 Tax=Anisodus acutangulus TaxID=402998 RepID=A0A9Q1RHX2_9SOLA|nr:hypothetical protein K7X08_027083 [Anisodus acutangulus]
MLVGIPNVGKSALANSLHQIGRISAAEKGRLKHAIVSPHPGETKSISGLKIASHPSIYVLDTPGVFPAEILDAEACSNLALTGAIRDCLVGEVELAEYFLSIFNSCDEYKKWAKLSLSGADDVSELERRQKRQYLTDHTQDFVVNKVRRTLFEAVSSFDGNLQDEEIMLQLIKAEFAVLGDAFNLPPDSDDYVRKVAAKLLNLYRTGRLGHYTLDPAPCNSLESLRWLLDKGMHYFELMKKSTIVLQIPHYVTIVDLLGRSGQFDRAKMFINEMPIKPNAAIWKISSSERLALAFALLNTPTESTIHFKKNLRIYDDGHTVFKFVSKVLDHVLVETTGSAKRNCLYMQLLTI